MHKKILAFVSIFTLLMQTAGAATFTVDTSSDTNDATPGDGTCADGGGDCSIRAAIEESNALVGTHTINVGGTDGGLTNAKGDVTITSDGLTIDGSEIGGIEGDTTTMGNLAIVIDADNVTIEDISIDNMGYGVEIRSGADNTVINGVDMGETTGVGRGVINFGTNTTVTNSDIDQSDVAVELGTGTEDFDISNSRLTNSANELFRITAANDTEGGDGGTEGIVIDNVEFSGSGGHGLVTNNASTDGSITVTNSYFGVENDGSTVNANASSNIYIGAAAEGFDVTVGTSGNGNQFTSSTNGGEIFVLDGGENTSIKGNTFGSSADGTALLGSQTNDAIYIFSSDVDDLDIGGSLVGERNVIVGTYQNPIEITGADAAATIDIENNYLGVYSGGTSGPGDSNDFTGAGARVAAGGTVHVTDNIIAGGEDVGLDIGDGPTTAVITGNKIGVTSDESALGNGAEGIYVDSDSITSLTVGGGNPGDGNVIGANTEWGLSVENLASAAATLLVQGNWVGIGSDFETDLGNAGGGLLLDSGIITVGGESDFASDIIGEGNVISFNGVDGVRIINGFSVLNFYGNIVGLYDAGESGWVGDGGNAGVGLSVDMGASTTAVNIGKATGTNVDSNRNIISSNGTYGINIQDNSELTDGEVPVTILNNYVGPTMDGQAALLAGNKNRTAGIYIDSGAVTIGGTGENEGNVISGNGVGEGQGQGIILKVISSATVLGNIIGLSSGGTLDVGNNSYGILVSELEAGATVTIGGASAAARNIISGNADDGIKINNTGVSATGIVNILGNYIGLSSDGSQAIGNDGHGILTSGLNTLNIGNGASGAGNVISANKQGGIAIDAGTVSVLGNYIGTAVDGTWDDEDGTGNGILQVNSSFNGGGIRVNDFNSYDPSVTIGNGDITDVNARNIISGNYGFGIMLSNTNGVTVQGNCIGTMSNCTLAAPNLIHANTSAFDFNGAGIVVSDVLSGAVSGTVIGGDTSNKGNVISGNEGPGIYIGHGTGLFLGAGQTWSNPIANNLIGYLVNGTSLLANGGYGIHVNGSGDDSMITGLSIGGSSYKNKINNDSQVGIYIEDTNLSNISTAEDGNTFWDNTCPVSDFAKILIYADAVLTGTYPVASVCLNESPVSSSSGGPIGGGGSSSPSSPSDSSSDVDSDVDNVDSELPSVPAEDVEDIGVIDEEGVVEEAEIEETDFIDENSVKPAETVVEVVSDALDQKEKQKLKANYVPVEVVADEELSEVEKAVRDFLAEESLDVLLETDVDLDLDLNLNLSEESREMIDSVGAIIGTIDSSEDTQKATEQVKNVLKNQVDTIVGANKAVGGGLLFTDGSGSSKLIDEDTEFVITMELDEQVALENQYSSEDKVVVVGPKTDLDGNQASDIVEMAYGAFGVDDGDEISFNDEIFLGLNPTAADTVSEEPFIANMQDTNLGKGIYSLRLGSAIEKDVSVAALCGEEEEEIDLGIAEIDEGYKGELTFDTTDLPEGECFILLRDGEEIVDVSRVFIQDEEGLNAPQITLINGHILDPISGDVVSQAASPSSTDEAILAGTTKPGSKVFVTWKSVIISSTVIADASGDFELDIPVEGRHEVIVYAYDEESDFLTQLSSILFFK